MDEHLKLLAEAGLALTEAEESIQADERAAAAGALDRADEHLAALRTRWAGMRAAERAIVGRAAAPLKQRLDRGRKRLQPRQALSQGAPSVTPSMTSIPPPRPPSRRRTTR